MSIDARRLGIDPPPNRKVAAWSAGFVFFVAAAVLLLGWGLGLDRFIRLYPGLPAMVPSTAMCFLLASGSITVELTKAGTEQRRRMLLIAAGVALIVVAGLNIALLAAGSRRGIDAAFNPWSLATTSDGMSPATAASFLAIASCLLLMAVKFPHRWLLFHAIAFLGLFVFLITTFEYVFDPAFVRTAPFFAKIALHTGVCFLLLFGALLFVGPGDGVAGIRRGSGPGSLRARLLLPAILGLPLVLYLGGQKVVAEAPFLSELPLFALAMLALTASLIMSSALEDDNADRRLREAFDRVNAVFESAPDAMLMVRADGRVSRANDMAVELFGYSKAQFDGMLVEQLIPEHLRAAHVNHRTQFARDPRTRRMGSVGLDLVGRRADGSEFVVSASLSPIGGKDSDLGVCVSIRDVGIERRMREQLALAQRLDAIGRMTSGVAHDFNNILSSLMANIQIIERQGPFASRAVNESIEGAMRATRRGAQLIERLLAFARRGSQHGVTTVSIASVFSDMSHLLRTATPSSIELSIEASPEEMAVRCDVTELETALLNLVSNARDAINLARGGRIELRASPADGAGNATRLVKLTVSDDGKGMNPDTARSATEPFYTTKALGAGTGLGLSMVAAFVQRASGQISIESTPGKGTTVTILLPRVELQEQRPRGGEAQVVVPLSTSPRAALNILVIDDDADLLPALARLLTTLGHYVVGVSTGAEAIAALERERHFDVLLCDISLRNNENGIELAGKLREGHPGLRVVLITGFTTLIEGHLGPLPGPVLYKPLDHDQLRDVLAHVVSAG